MVINQRTGIVWFAPRGEMFSVDLCRARRATRGEGRWLKDLFMFRFLRRLLTAFAFNPILFCGYFIAARIGVA